MTPIRAAQVGKAIGIGLIVIGVLCVAVTGVALAVIFAPPFLLTAPLAGIAIYLAVGTGVGFAILIPGGAILVKKNIAKMHDLYNKYKATINTTYPQFSQLNAARFEKIVDLYNELSKQYADKFNSIKDFTACFMNFTKKNTPQEMADYLDRLGNKHGFFNDELGDFYSWFFLESIKTSLFQNNFTQHILSKLQRINMDCVQFSNEFRLLGAIGGIATTLYPESDPTKD